MTYVKISVNICSLLMGLFPWFTDSCLHVRYGNIFFTVSVTGLGSRDCILSEQFPVLYIDFIISLIM